MGVRDQGSGMGGQGLGEIPPAMQGRDSDGGDLPTWGGQLRPPRELVARDGVWAGRQLGKQCAHDDLGGCADVWRRAVEPAGFGRVAHNGPEGAGDRCPLGTVQLSGTGGVRHRFGELYRVQQRSRRWSRASVWVLASRNRIVPGTASIGNEPDLVCQPH